MDDFVCVKSSDTLADLLGKLLAKAVIKSLPELRHECMQCAANAQLCDNHEFSLLLGQPEKLDQVGMLDV